jgi:hypothetical protein
MSADQVFAVINSVAYLTIAVVMFIAFRKLRKIAKMREARTPSWHPREVGPKGE